MKNKIVLIGLLSFCILTGCTNKKQETTDLFSEETTAADDFFQNTELQDRDVVEKITVNKEVSNEDFLEFFSKTDINLEDTNLELTGNNLYLNLVREKDNSYSHTIINSCNVLPFYLNVYQKGRDVTYSFDDETFYNEQDAYSSDIDMLNISTPNYSRTLHISPGNDFEFRRLDGRYKLSGELETIPDIFPYLNVYLNTDMKKDNFTGTYQIELSGNVGEDLQIEKITFFLNSTVPTDGQVVDNNWVFDENVFETVTDDSEELEVVSDEDNTLEITLTPNHTELVTCPENVTAIQKGAFASFIKEVRSEMSRGNEEILHALEKESINNTFLAGFKTE
jgi:hypothetical protein